MLLVETIRLLAVVVIVAGWGQLCTTQHAAYALHAVCGAFEVVAFAAKDGAMVRMSTVAQALRVFARITASTRWRKNSADSFERRVVSGQRDPSLGQGHVRILLHTLELFRVSI